MTYNYKDTHLPMKRIQDFLKDLYLNQNYSYKDLAEKCSTTPATMKKWITHGPDLKWYSLMDICLAFNLKLLDIFKDTIWEELCYARYA